jgi:ParB family transcriptional regulator, chromosome partitioning protein
MASKPKRLGKGLGSLIKAPVQVESGAATAPPTNSTPQPGQSYQAPRSSTAPHSSTPHTDVSRGTSGARTNHSDESLELTDGISIQQIPIDDIRPNPAQPRRSFDEIALKQLSDSIAQHGLLQPIVARRVSNAAGPSGGGGGVGQTSGWVELIAGERRWRAAKMAGLESIPAIVREASDQTSAELALIENLLREDLNVVERAMALRELCDRYAMTHGQIADRIGQDRSSVTNLLRLLELDGDTLELLASGRLSMGHGRALLSVRDTQRREELSKLASQEQWSVRELERRCKEPPAPRGVNAPLGAPVRSTAVVDLERRLGEQLGTKVAIATDKSGKRGTMTFAFYGLEHFESLLQRLGLNDRDA